MKNKVVISLIIIALMIATITGILIMKSDNKNVYSSNEKVSKIETENIVENEIETNDISEDPITNVINEEKEQEVIEEEEKIVSEQPMIKQENTTKTDNKEQKANNVVVKPKEEKQVQEQVQEQVHVSQPKEEPKIVEKKTETIQETKPNIPQCTETSHGVGVGNSKKWFNSKQDAVAYYDNLIKTWGDKWEKFEIDSETYDKNCPYGYEVWTCPFCGKWTINFYYR